MSKTGPNQSGASTQAMASPACGSAACGSSAQPTKTPIPAFVGMGRGQYKQETTYRYVGNGVGEFDLVSLGAGKNKAVTFGCVLLFLGFAAVLTGFLCWKLFRAGGTETTTSPANSFNCAAGLSNWEAGWSLSKKTFCCQTVGKGCAQRSSQTLVHYTCNDLDLISGWATPKKTWCCEHAGIACAVAKSHDCMDGISNWLAGWSQEKKDWCCSHETKGCAPKHTVIPIASTIHGGGTTSPAYDCNSGFSAWESAWSDGKKKWCCHNGGRGCAGPVNPCDVDCSVAGKGGICRERFQRTAIRNFASQADACAKALTQVVSQCPMCKACSLAESRCANPTLQASLPYDCDAGLSNADQGWSVNKRVWCCQHKSKGCPNTVRPTAKPFDCAAGYSNWQHGWAAAKKVYCCDHEGRGCQASSTSVPYDCLAGFSKWKTGWPVAKKEWCCHHRHRGCPESVSDARHDCEAGFSNWKKGWSFGKKAWCCEHGGRGCPELSTSVPFDCLDGYSKWETLWTGAKKKWCCENRARGCGHDDGR